MAKQGIGQSAHPEIEELPGTGCVDVIRKQAAASGERSPVGVHADQLAQERCAKLYCRPANEFAAFDDVILKMIWRTTCVR